MIDHGWVVGQYVKDKYYHPEAQGKIISIKDRTMYVKFGDKHFKYDTDTTSLIRI